MLLRWNIFKLNENNNPTILLVEEEDYEECISMVIDMFKEYMGEDEIREYVEDSVDWEISVKLIKDSKIIGCYLFAENDLDYPEFNNLIGVEGIALYVLPEYRNLGYGKMLIDFSEKMSYDYIWGQHLKILKNLEPWKKRRPLLYDGDSVDAPKGYEDCWITAKFL